LEKMAAVNSENPAVRTVALIAAVLRGSSAHVGIRMGSLRELTEVIPILNLIRPASINTAQLQEGVQVASKPLREMLRTSPTAQHVILNAYKPLLVDSVEELVGVTIWSRSTGLAATLHIHNVFTTTSLRKIISTIELATNQRPPFLSDAKETRFETSREAIGAAQAAPAATSAEWTDWSADLSAKITAGYRLHEIRAWLDGRAGSDDEYIAGIQFVYANKAGKPEIECKVHGTTPNKPQIINFFPGEGVRTVVVESLVTSPNRIRRIVFDADADRRELGVPRSKSAVSSKPIVVKTKQTVVAVRHHYLDGAHIVGFFGSTADGGMVVSGCVAQFVPLLHADEGPVLRVTQF